MSARQKEGRSGRDIVAQVVDAGLPLLGVAIVLAAVVLGGGGWRAIWMAVSGLLLVEAGVWRLGSRVMYERRYMPLRQEVRRFIGLARDLHHATTAAREGGLQAQADLDRTLAAMRASVDRMAAVAAKTEADLAAGGASSPEPGTATAGANPARAASR